MDKRRVFRNTVKLQITYIIQTSFYRKRKTMKKIFEAKEDDTNRETVYYWNNKYIALLEKYNELLLKESIINEKNHEMNKVFRDSSNI